METKDQVKTLLKEAELYHSQGLLDEAKETYMYISQLFKKNQELMKDKNLVALVSKKIKALKQEIKKFEDEPIFKEMPEKVQEIIKTKFVFSKDGDEELEGAIALAKFGQYERALKEFNTLIQKESVRVDAAINIIRCYRTLDSIGDAISLYEQWAASKLFEPNQINKVRVFLQSILTKKGINQTLPSVKDKQTDAGFSEAEFSETQVIEPGVMELGTAEPEISEPDVAGLELSQSELSEEDIPDISSVEITLDKGARKGENIEFDVSFQSGKTINLLISGKDKEVIENLKIGIVLNSVRFYSPMAMFSGKGKVTSRSEIESGPKQGDFSLDIEISLT